jgi:hypothetical protein
MAEPGSLPTSLNLHVLAALVVRSAKPLLLGMPYQLENGVGRREWCVVLKVGGVDRALATLTRRFNPQFVEE